MKKKYVICLASLLLLARVGFSQTEATIAVGNTTRSYVYFMPSNYDASKPVGLFLLLHGSGGNQHNYDNTIANYAIPDTHNTIVICPQALSETDTEVIAINNAVKNFGKEPFNITNIWNSGTTIATTNVVPSEYLFLLASLAPNIAAAGKIELNKATDDVLFMNTLITYFKTNYNIDGDRVFMAGHSMGGSMCYRYAFSDNRQIKAFASIYGYLGKGVDTSKRFQIPFCHFHSKTDEVVPFYGGIFNDSIPITIQLLAQKNGQTTPIIEEIADTKADNITVKSYDYNTPDNPRVLFFEIDGALHANILQQNDNDIDVFNELWRFFEGTPIESGLNNQAANDLTVYPNPTSDYIISSKSGAYQLVDISGKICQQGYTEAGQSLSIGTLQKGIYILTLTANHTSTSHKIIIQ